MARYQYIARLILLVVGFVSIESRADSALIAVASNFSAAAKELAMRYETETGHELRLSTASTGKLFAQIENGAPFDVLLAADSERPTLLDSSGLGVSGSRFTYAIGRLVLWSRDEAFAGGDCRHRLNDLGSRRLAVANPDTAPYGSAARQVLEQLNLFERVRGRLVIAENIAQTMQFVASGNASLGFVAASQVADARLPQASCSWTIPSELHDPIEQQAILLSRAASNIAAAEFLRYLRSEGGLRIIAAHGYSLPGQVR